MFALLALLSLLDPAADNLSFDFPVFGDCRCLCFPFLPASLHGLSRVASDDLLRWRDPLGEGELGRLCLGDLDRSRDLDRVVRTGVLERFGIFAKVGRR